jgi:DDE superfamily endonuclease
MMDGRGKVLVGCRKVISTSCYEYYRHGTLSLYAALDAKTGRVHGRTTARHTSRDFVAFLAEVVTLCSPRQQIHIILDNLSAHKTQLVRDFLQQHPRVQLHFTPTYSSWLQQVELWFAKIEREVIARGMFTSVPDLARKLRRYINAYSATAAILTENTTGDDHAIPVARKRTTAPKQVAFIQPADFRILVARDTIVLGTRANWTKLGKNYSIQSGCPYHCRR